MDARQRGETESLLHSDLQELPYRLFHIKWIETNRKETERKRDFAKYAFAFGRLYECLYDEYIVRFRREDIS